MSSAGKIIETMHLAMQNNPLFGDLLSVEDREFLLERGTVRPVQPDEVLCRRYQRDHRVFILINGTVEVSEDVNGEKVVLGSLHSGEVFGEIAALFMRPRVATVTVTRPSVILEIPAEALQDLMERVPVIRDAVLQRYRDRTVNSSLKLVPSLSALSQDDLRDLGEHASLLTAKKDEIIINEGEQGDAVFILNYGAARVYTNVDGMNLNLAVLRAGDYFGEWSLLTGAPRAASVAALTQLQAIRLGREPFLDFISKHPEVRDSIDMEAHSRRNNTTRLRQRPESAADVRSILDEIKDIIGED